MTDERRELFEKNKSRLTLSVGNKVRLQKAKEGVLEKGYKQQYTQRIYTVEKIIHPKDGVPMYRLSGRGKTNFSADRLMKVDEDKLIEIPEEEEAPRQRAPPRAAAVLNQRPLSQRQRRPPEALADFVLQEAPRQRAPPRADAVQNQRPQRQRRPPGAMAEFVL